MTVRDWQDVQAQGARRALMGWGHRPLSLLDGAGTRRRPCPRRFDTHELTIDAVSSEAFGDVVQTFGLAGHSAKSVSYTHLTLPTNREV